MKNKKTLNLGYCLANLIAMIAFYVFGALFYMTEFAKSSSHYSEKYIFLTLAIFTVPFIVLCIINGKVLRSAFGVLMNIAFPISILNVAVLIKRVGSIGIWCVMLAAAAVTIIKVIIWLEGKLPTTRLCQKLLGLSSKESEDVGTEIFEDKYDAKATEQERSLSKRIYRTVGAVFIALAVLSTFAMCYYGIFQVHNSTYSDDVNYHEKYIANEDMHEYVKIDSKYWETLDVDAKLEVLQKIAEHEAARLGLPDAPAVTAADLSDDDYVADYNVDENLIELDINTVKYGKDGYIAVKALANCAYYAYDQAKKQLLEAIKSDEATSKYSTLGDIKADDPIALEENARKYSEYVQSEYRRKIQLFKFNENKEHY